MDGPYVDERFKLSFEAGKIMKIPINISIYTIQKIVNDSPKCLVVSSIHPKTNQKIAIKCIPIRYFNEFSKEDLIMRRVNHPYIIKLIDSFFYPTNKPRFFAIVMPLAVTDLDYYIFNNGPLQEAMVWKIMKDSLNAIKHLHDNNIWHRDLKLDNILVVEEGKDGLRTVISDFGVSDIIESNAYNGVCVGTLEYAAPELLEFNQGKLEFKTITNCMFLMIQLIFGHIPKVIKEKKHIYDFEKFIIHVYISL